MLAAFLTATARHRRLILGIAVVLGVGWPAVQPLVRSADPVSGQHLLEGQFAIVVTMGLLAIVSWSRPVRPAAFAVDPQVPTFRTFPEATQVFVALLFIGMSSAQVAMFFPIQGNGAPSEDPDDRMFVALWLTAAGLNVWACWRGVGVELRPQGLVQRNVLGVLTVPWDALAAGDPPRPDLKAPNLALTYARPALVRRRGIGVDRRLLSIGNVHPWFIADAIRYYATYPEHRAAIGTQAEYERLVATLNGPGPA